MPAYLSSVQLERDLSLTDLSDPANGPHAIQLLVEAAVAALTERWGCEARWCRGPRVVSVADNYDHLGYPAAAVTRDTRYTRYADDQTMLRSHSTAMVPPALRRLAADPPDDMLLVCPGIVYRRDAIDWQHTGTPHQLDLWRVSRRPLGQADMDEMIGVLLGVLMPGNPPSRQEPRQHPYTTGGRQVDVAHADGWVEVWECGVASQTVLARAGLPGHTGLALGMGLDRLLMLRKQIPDIRLLRSADPRIASQMRDLTPYQPVSTMPAVRRDLSVMVEPAEDGETLGGRIRDALGADADCVEDVAVLASTDYDLLPPAAAERLGARPGQRNLLVRIVLRHLERTLTDADANALRDRVYAAIHQGTRHQWAAGSDSGARAGAPRLPGDALRPGVDVHRCAAQEADQGQPGLIG
jgi:phenylalanyl-tRNA synthetase alpha chain